MSETVNGTEIEGEMQEHLRAEVKRVLAGRAIRVAADGAGIPYGTFTGWLGGSYAGNTSRVAEAAQRWLNGQETHVRTRALIPNKPDFVETPTARAVLSALEFAQHTPDFVMVAGGAGVGKTTAVARHKATNPNVFVITGEPCFNTPRMVLDSLAEALGLTEKYSSEKVSRAIQRRLRGSGGLVVVDEAQHFNSQSLDQMRTLHDLAGVGVALVGNETVYNRMEGHGRQAQFAQLYSRVGMRLSRPRPQNNDIAAMLDAWGISAGDVRGLLTEIARKPGAFRGMTKALCLAHVLGGGAALTTDTIRRAWEQISATKIVADVA